MNESISFKTLHQIGKGNIYNFLSNAYQKYASFDPRAIEEWIKGWKDFDDFVFSFTDEDASFGFSTFLGNKAIGFSSWDPRQFPIAIVGHNCILSDYQCKDLGKMQMMETINRLRIAGFKKAKATTGELTFFIPAQKMYTFCGFQEFERRYGDKNSDFQTIHYEMLLV